MRIRKGRMRDLHLDPALHELATEEPEPESDPDPRLPALRAAMRQLKPDERPALILFYAIDPSRGDGGRYRRIMALSRGVSVNGAAMLRWDVGDMSLMEPSRAQCVM